MFEMHVTFGQLIMALLAGGLLGAIFSDRAAPYRKYLWAALALLVFVYTYRNGPIFVPPVMLFAAGVVVARRLLSLPDEDDMTLEDVYGTAQLASPEYLEENNLLDPLITQRPTEVTYGQG